MLLIEDSCGCGAVYKGYYEESYMDSCKREEAMNQHSQWLVAHQACRGLQPKLKAIKENLENN